MAYATITQGESRANNEFGVEVLSGITYDSVTIELSSEYATKLKYRWPTTTGYLPLTKSGNKFYFPLTTAQSALMLGIYTLEWVVFDGTEQVMKIPVKNFLQVNPESK